MLNCVSIFFSLRYNTFVLHIVYTFESARVFLPCHHNDGTTIVIYEVVLLRYED